MGSSLFYFLLFIFVGLSSNSLAETHPAVFQTDLGPISTLNQYKERVLSLYPSMTHEFTEGLSVEHNETQLEAQLFYTEGSIGSIQHKQSLVYGEISPGLWKLISLNSESCNFQMTTINGVTEETLICDDRNQWLPINGNFADIFLVESSDLDLNVLSEVLGREVSVYTPPGEEVLLTLSEVETILIASGATWSQETAVWNGFGGQSEDQPAISIQVTGEPNERIRFDQTFLYFFRDDQLVLGSVSGDLCEYLDRVDDFVCDEAAHPTEYTPFPFLLSNAQGSSDTTSVEVEAVVQEDGEPLTLSCGFLDQNYSRLLRYHFERGSFELFEIDGFRKAVTRIVDVLDPENLLITDRDREIFARVSTPPFLFAPQIDELANAIRNGVDGECGVLVDLTEDLFLNLQDTSEKVLNFLDKVDKRPNGSDSVSLNDPFDLKLWAWVLDKASELEIFVNSKSSAIDIALGQLKVYLDDALSLTSDYELLLTSAFFKADEYSHLINQKRFSSMIDSQSTQGKFFGLRVIKGLKAHYILSLHPKTQSQYGLKAGDEIISVNGTPASGLSNYQMDAILLDTNVPLKLKVRRDFENFIAILEAANLDFLSMSFDFDKTKENERVYLLKLDNFSIGLTERIHEILAPLIEQDEIDGLVLDLTKNVGGDVEEARRFLSLFIDKAPLFYSKIGARGTTVEPDLQSPSSEYLVSSTLPFVVIVSDQTKSAAEIVASSLKAHERALVIGGRTFGKFVAQRVFPITLSNQMQVGLSVTVAEFFDPEGNSLNGFGLEPLIRTLDSDPVFADGNSLGQNYVGAQILDNESSFVSGLNLGQLVQDGSSFISSGQSLGLALLAIDQSQKDEDKSGVTTRTFGYID